jgi:2-polyprenyl-6-hydroxyphenyl methylase/3-demethylubiquinone-9 3-methyltransferase
MNPVGWNHSTHEKFYDYYAKESQSKTAINRFRSVKDCVVRFLDGHGRSENIPLEVADIGCGAGTQSMIWAESGHHVHGLDVNRPLVELARERASTGGYTIDFRVGSATELPWSDKSMDVCIVLELLEHVRGWEECLTEFDRILRPGGVLFLTTTNRLCPLQAEFNLPLFSWYPTKIKRHYEAIANTTRPEIVNYATYPAVNWFSFFDLRSWMGERGFYSHDRFDVMELKSKGRLNRGLVSIIRSVPMIRYLAHVATPGTMLLAIKGVRPTNKERRTHHG